MELRYETQYTQQESLKHRLVDNIKVDLN